MSKEIQARQEIHLSLRLTNFCTRKIGLSFIDEEPKSFVKRFRSNLLFVISALSIGLLVVGEILEVIYKLNSSSSVEVFVSKLHIVGYGIMSSGKFLTLWHKQATFRNLLTELAELWPIEEEDEDAVRIKRQKLARLRVVQFCYALWNIMGVIHYNSTPVALYYYNQYRGEPAPLGFIWEVWYPFDKTKPVCKVFALTFEVFAGVVGVWSMLGSDIIFMTMSSHISMLLELLQLKIRRLGLPNTDPSSQNTQIDCYNEIKNIIKIHQRLISYGNALEDTFSVVNLINVLLSSINICCVAFNILLEPLVEMSNKLFLGAALTQVGILCWYADEITTASTGIGHAAYQCGWFHITVKCRRALLVLLQRSQKPLHFTAYKFSAITMSTYSSIIANSYSYFTLLYTMYRSN
ncbi:odorant receptor 4-like [Aricia agestis]|uniref:odorant receptor 4-like n=1 Tax=Aricia agestis TaxID=91739 RepID=UPI001C20387C|nr:odorant receptor 4-like [Aricia agestis]